MNKIYFCNIDINKKCEVILNDWIEKNNAEIIDIQYINICSGTFKAAILWRPYGD